MEQNEVMLETPNSLLKNKKLWIIGGAALAVIVAIIVAVSLVSYRSSLKYFAKVVKDEYSRAYCIVSSSGQSVSIDTNPYDQDAYDFFYSMSKTEQAVFSATQSDSTKGIALMNEMLGFDADLAEEMGETTSSMGKKTAENEKYKVEWSYSSDEGLEVTWYKK